MLKFKLQNSKYEEARAAESRADFIHKMQIVLKELRESNYWIKLIIAGRISAAEGQHLDMLLNESRELVKIIAKSVITSKSSHSKT